MLLQTDAYSGTLSEQMKWKAAHAGGAERLCWDVKEGMRLSCVPRGTPRGRGYITCIT
jgi:hypothetical protein